MWVAKRQGRVVYEKHTFEDLEIYGPWGYCRLLARNAVVRRLDPNVNISWWEWSTSLT